jgi:predicted RNase H-like nuclease
MAGVLGIDATWTEKGPGQELDVVTVDMPLSTVPITGRREADTAISRAFGGKGAAVHSPSADRPGLISTKMREGFAAAEFPLATSTTPVGTPHHLVEVYPHPALLSLTGANSPDVQVFQMSSFEKGRGGLHIWWLSREAMV